MKILRVYRNHIKKLQGKKISSKMQQNTKTRNLTVRNATVRNVTVQNVTVQNVTVRNKTVQNKTELQMNSPAEGLGSLLSDTGPAIDPWCFELLFPH